MKQLSRSGAHPSVNLFHWIYDNTLDRYDQVLSLIFSTFLIDQATAIYTIVSITDILSKIRCAAASAQP